MFNKLKKLIKDPCYLVGKNAEALSETDVG